MSGRSIFPPLYKGEKVEVSFDFSSVLGRTDSPFGTPTATCEVYLGEDANAAILTSGAPTRVGNVVTVTFNTEGAAGIAGVTYVVACNLPTSRGNLLTLHGFITVLPSQP